LMAFILLLILSITTLVRVETQSANIQLAQLEARMNAQLGAMIALGDLQRYTGPDQRVTARADILLAPGDIDLAGQSRWTGVWSSKDSDPDEAGYQFDQLDQDAGLGKDGSGKHKARWLVSGNGSDPSATALDPNAQLTVETADLATLGGSVTNKSNTGQDDTVKAPKVEILGDDNVTKGHYAYWVSDEGVKARVNMADPHLLSVNPEAEYYRTAMAQVADPTAVSNSAGVQLLTGTSSRWKDENQDPGKIGSLKNIPMFLEDDLPGEDLSNVSREFFHDFTAHSRGVLANTKDGGLKRDLSTALLNLPDDMKEGGENSPMFPPANGPSGPGQMNPGGPKWEQLSDYYKLAYDNSKLPSDDDIPLRVPTNEQVGFTPVITRSNFFVQGFAERNKAREDSGSWCLNTNTATLPGTELADWGDPDGSTNPLPAGDWYYAKGYRYSLGMFPLVTLWNPYDRDMVLGDLGLEFELPKIDIVAGPGSTTSVAAVGNYTSRWNNSSAVKRWTVRFVIRGIGLTLKAGEALNFSPPCNSFYDNSDPTENVLVARASAPYVNGFFTPAVESSSDQPFWDNGNIWQDPQAPYTTRGVIADDDTRSQLSLNFSNPDNDSLWKQQVMLYSSPDLTGSDFSPENRFKAIDTYGFGVFGGTNKAKWQMPRVILTNRLMGISDSGLYDSHINEDVGSNINYLDPFTLSNRGGTSYFDDFIRPSGESKETDHTYPYTDLINGKTLSSDALAVWNPWGAVSAMRFPNVSPRTFANNGNESEIHLFLNMNPTAPVIHKEPNITYVNTPDIQRLSQSNVYSQGHIMPWHRASADLYYDQHIAAETFYEQARFGLSNTASGGSERMVLFEVPDNIPLSIGQLTHANLMNFDVLSAGLTLPAIGNIVEGNGGKWHSHTLQTYATPAYAIGNSLANPFLPLASTEEWFSSVRDIGVPAAHYDYSYKLNDALWDDYFFSGITDPNPTFPLPNSRLSPSNPSLIDSDLTTENLAAANLLLDGAFNINSTSVAAWESVIGAMRDIETLGYSKDSTLRHNFARFNEPLMGLATTGESVPQLSNKDQLAAGYRNLTDAQIASLASEIVDEIRLRKNSATGEGYPFLSLSEFINRSPNSNTKAFAWRGALQAAIDKANLNGLEPDSTGLWAESAKYPLYYGSGDIEDMVNADDTPIIDRPKADGMPGAFMQSDLLAKISAFIQARSDTFTIRSYGSSREQFGSEDGSRAYYEMVVQRTPAYVDPSDPDYVNDYGIPTQLTDTNEKFGRNYEIKSQRWVAADEI